MSRLDCSSDEGMVLLLVVIASCVSGVPVFVVEVTYESSEYGGTGVEVHGVE